MSEWYRINIGFDYRKPEPTETVWIAMKHTFRGESWFSWILGYIDEDGDWCAADGDVYLDEFPLYAWHECTIPAPPEGEKWGI